jgi:hypothetical protein
MDRPYQPAQVHTLGAFDLELGAIALGGGPLITEGIGRYGLALGAEKIDEAQDQERTLTEAYVRVGGGTRRDPPQEHGVRQGSGNWGDS